MRSQHRSLWTIGSTALQPLVLVVEHEPRAGRSIGSTLASHGFRTLHVGTGADALTRAVRHEPNLLLIDMGGPAIDGVGLTAQLREGTSAPILVLLEPGLEQQRGAFLDAGANDYILRPFATEDLLARMRVWLRQTARNHAGRPLLNARAERVRFDREGHSLFVDDRKIHITPTEWKLLLILAHSAGRAMSEQQVLSALWGSGSSTRLQYLRAHVRQLRQKIERDPARPRHLLTEMGGSYRLKLG